jgi:2,4-dienoyl-CoA reductase-like NADH-dependent reductase (Old Yellow Enzyme family)
MASLFEPLKIRGTTFSNRIWVSPMCQYSGIDGVATTWHDVHIGSFATGGTGMIMMEASGVVPEGRISTACLGLWNDAQTERVKPIVEFAPSAISFGGKYPVPKALTETEISDLVTSFAESAKRAVSAGFDLVEIHAAHGYLIHQFLSPISNKREDNYGGSFENRVRFILEITKAVRSVIPDSMPLFVRISASDWLEDGWSIDDSVELCKLLKATGVDLIDVSSGGTSSGAPVPVRPGYQVPFATRIKQDSNIPTCAVGLITEPKQADVIVKNGEADAVMMAREFLRNPRWPFHAAKELNAEVSWPVQLLRGKA